MIKLNLPEYPLQIICEENQKKIWDIIRQKFILLTPEEWVRQNIIHYLLQEKKYPQTLIAVEKMIKVGKLAKRFDITVYDKNIAPLLLVECKAPNVKIDNEVLSQALRYNLTLQVKYVMITNGISHHFFSLDYETQEIKRIDPIPSYNEIHNL